MGITLDIFSPYLKVCLHSSHFLHIHYADYTVLHEMYNQFSFTRNAEGVHLWAMDGSWKHSEKGKVYNRKRLSKARSVLLTFCLQYDQCLNRRLICQVMSELYTHGMDCTFTCCSLNNPVLFPLWEWMQNEYYYGVFGGWKLSNFCHVGNHPMVECRVAIFLQDFILLVMGRYRGFLEA